MKLPSSSSLLLASLAVSSSSSSLSALAAPTGDGPESFSSSAALVPAAPVLAPPVPAPPVPAAPVPAPPVPAPPVPAPPVPAPPVPLHHDSIDGPKDQVNDYMQASGMVDGAVTGVLPPALSGPLLNLVDGLLDIIVGSHPKAREVPLDEVKQSVPLEKTVWAEEAEGRGEHAACEDSSMQPFASQSDASAPPAPEHQGAPLGPRPPVSLPNPPTQPSGPTRRQALGRSNGESQGKSNAPVPHPPAPLPSPPSSGPGAQGGSPTSPGGNEGGGD